jgi:hypothetical protein
MQQLSRAFLQNFLLHPQLDVHAPCQFFAKPIKENDVSE